MEAIDALIHRDREVTTKVGTNEAIGHEVMSAMHGVVRRGSVSVVIPTRNRLTLLAQTLHTVLAQDLPAGLDLEVIIVDEASTDDTPNWLATHPDPRVRTIRHDTPRGLSNARNAGIAAATGNWLGFVDDDDLWLPNKLTDQLAAAHATGAHWAYGGAITFTDGPALLYVSIPDPDLPDRLLFGNTVPGGGSNAIVSRVALERIGDFDPSVDIVADWDLWIRLLQFGPPAVVARPVMAYRIHGANMSRNTPKMLDGIRTLEHRYAPLRDGEPIDWPNVYRWLHVRSLHHGDRATARSVAMMALRAGYPGAARRLLRTFAPVLPRRPVTDPRDANGMLDLIRPRRVIPWPGDSEDWLRHAARIVPG